MARVGPAAHEGLAEHLGPTPLRTATDKETAMTDRRIIGIDCAVDPCHVGVANGVLSGDQLSLIDVKLCSCSCLPAATAAAYAQGHGDVLFALDAPLGWSRHLGPELFRHSAGQPMEVSADRLFRRETDGFVRENVGKQPLDVGADRIARTARDALDVLQAIGTQLGEQVELAWDESARGRKAIEVYPAATLKAHGVRASGYKKPEDSEGRREIAAALEERMTIKGGGQLLLKNSHALDAAVCVLAGADFFRGQSLRPKDPLTSRQEGWIWVRNPQLESARKPLD